MIKRTYLLLCLLLTTMGAMAQLSLPNVFDDDMVLQQGKRVCVWGEARPAAKVSVAFAGQRVATVADEEGKWRLYLGEMTASAEPRKMVVSSGRERLVFENVLVGEVWLASGQSNMEYSMGNHNHYPRPARGDRDVLMKAHYEANDALVRVLYVSRNMSVDTLPTTGWHTVGYESLKPVSAAGYFFAKELADSLKVPIGLISSSWGGTPVEEWTPREAFEKSQFGEDVDSKGFYGNVKVAWRYDHLIAPMVPYTLRGFLWYNGEQNLMTGDTDIYADKQMLMVDAWREVWGDEQMPFYYVQLAPYAYSNRRNLAIPCTWATLPLFWEAQKRALAQPHTGMVSTFDLVDDVSEIHPPYKWIVGSRLAKMALARSYGFENIEPEGPVFKGYTIEGDQVVVEFDNVSGGLKTSDSSSAVTFFCLAGADGRFFPAEAKIISPTKIALTCTRVKASRVVDVSFGWDEESGHNLHGGNGLPAQPFNTLFMRQQ